MPQTTKLDQYGQPETVVTFDHDAHARWKADQATWRRTRYAASARIRAARSKTNAAAYKTRKARKIATKKETK